MPMTTHLSDSEVRAFKVADPDVREWLDLARQCGGESLHVEERTFPVARRWFRRAKTVVLYSVYSRMNGTEYQIVNFAPKLGGSSINGLVERQDVMNYLIGRVTGFDAAKK